MFDVDIKKELEIIDENVYLKIFCFNINTRKYDLLVSVNVTEKYLKNKKFIEYYSYDLFSNKSRV